MTLRQLALATLLLPVSLAAQVPAGETAWVAGDFHTARIAYERALEEDSTSVRALYRLGILAAWDGRTDSALALLGTARRYEPDDPDIRLQEATFLAWASRFPASLARFDSLRSAFPDRQDIALGQAQTLAWAGRLHQADQAYAAVLEQDPEQVAALTGRGQVAAWSGNNLTAIQYYQKAIRQDSTYVPALIGLAQVRQWQGRPDEATAAINRALALAPKDRTAQEVHAAIRALVRPELNLTLGWSRDSDKNTLWWQTASLAQLVATGIRGFASAGVAEASDPVRNGTRLSAEAGATVNHGSVSLTGALGVRHLASDGADSRSLATWRASASYRFTPGAGAGIGYSHYSFDETALLLGRDLDIDELSVDADVQLSPRLGLGVGAGRGWLSDGNRRSSAVAALTQQVGNHLALGLFGRVLGYADPGAGYFTPDRFAVGEVRGSYTYGARAWAARLSAGVGAQQIGIGADAQSEWHAEARIARRWATINEVALSGGLTNSAVSSTTGAFRYYTMALSLRLGL